MELRHLRYLVAVADAGTFVRAAERLRVAQPALTRQLRDLRDELQVDLFVRGARKATLTSAGEAAVGLARNLIRDASRAVERARLSEIGLAGRCVVVAGPLAVLSGFLASLVARIKDKYPAIELSVTEAGGQQQWDAIRNGRADVGLGVPAARSYATLVNELQYEDRVDVALVAADHPLANRQSVVLDDLRGYPLFALEDTGSEPDKVKLLLVKELQLRGFASAGAREVAGVDDLVANVRAGHGWTFLPRLMRSRFPPLVGIPIEDFSVPFQTARIWRRSEVQPAVHTVLEELRALRRESGACAHSAGRASSHRDDTRRHHMTPRLELRHVRSFAAVARWGSFGRAASERHISQPALSRQMRSLEQDLGVRLFERGSRGMDLTPPGETFRRDVATLLDDVDRLHKEVKRAERGTTGLCVMGVVPHVHIDRIVSDVLDALRCTEARVQIEARSLTTPQLGEALRKSEIDVAVAYAYPMPVAQMDGLARRSLFADELRCAMLPATHPLTDRESLSLSDLRDVPFLFPQRAVLPRLYDAVMQQFSAARVTPRVDAEYEGVLTIWTLTAQGIGWSLGTAIQLKAPPAGTRCVPLNDFYLPWGAEVVFRQDESRPAVLLLTDMLLEVARRLELSDVAKCLPKSA